MSRPLSVSRTRIYHLATAIERAKEARFLAAAGRATTSHAKLDAAVRSLQSAYNHARSAYLKAGGVL